MNYNTLKMKKKLMIKKTMLPLALIALCSSGSSFCPPRPDLPGNASSHFCPHEGEVQIRDGRVMRFKLMTGHCCPDWGWVDCGPAPKSEEPAKLHVLEVVAGKAATDTVARLATDLEKVAIASR